MRLYIILDLGYHYILINHNCSNFLFCFVFLACVFFFLPDSSTCSNNFLYAFGHCIHITDEYWSDQKKISLNWYHVKLPILLQYQNLVENIAIFKCSLVLVLWRRFPNVRTYIVYHVTAGYYTKAMLFFNPMRYHMLPLRPVSNIWTLPFFYLTGGRDLCPAVVLWLRQETDTGRAHTHWSDISLSSIRVSPVWGDTSSPQVYFLWTWFHEDEWRRYCPLLPHRACSCSPTQYTQKLPRDEKLSRMLSFTNERPPFIFLPVTWKNASPPLFSFLLSSSSSQSGSIHSSQSIC